LALGWVHVEIAETRRQRTRRCAGAVEVVRHSVAGSLFGAVWPPGELGRSATKSVMLDQLELRRLVDMQHRSYLLLMWMASS
jgi:hypothetical protein